MSQSTDTACLRDDLSASLSFMVSVWAAEQCLEKASGDYSTALQIGRCTITVAKEVLEAHQRFTDLPVHVEISDLVDMVLEFSRKQTANILRQLWCMACALQSYCKVEGIKMAYVDVDRDDCLASNMDAFSTVVETVARLVRESRIREMRGYLEETPIPWGLIAEAYRQGHEGVAGVDEFVLALQLGQEHECIRYLRSGLYRPRSLRPGS